MDAVGREHPIDFARSVPPSGNGWTFAPLFAHPYWRHTHSSNARRCIGVTFASVIARYRLFAILM